MKKNLSVLKKTMFWTMATMLLMPSIVRAEIDPFSVYSLNAPTGCVDKELGTKKLDLADLVQIGICRNPTLSRGFMDVKISEAGYGAQKSEYLPTITGSGAISADRRKIQGTSTTNNGPLSGNIALDWLLFDFGGRTARAEQMKAYLDSAGFTYNALLQTTVLNITTSYYTLLANQAVLDSAKASEISFKKSFEESGRRYDLGLVPLNDKLLAQTSYEQSKLVAIRAANAVQGASGNLATILNLPPDIVFDLNLPKRNNDSIKLETDKGIQELIDLAIGERSEIKAKNKEEEAAKQGIDIAKSVALPTLSVGANISGTDDWRRSSNPYQYTGTVGLQLNVPIFTGFRNTYDISQARFSYQRAGFDTQATVDTVKNEVWGAWQDYNTAVAAFDISKKVMASAQENQRLAFEMYQVGQGSILNLLLAESQLAEALQENATSFFQVLISKANLYRSIGRF